MTVDRTKTVPTFGLVPVETVMTTSGLDLLKGIIAGRFPGPPIMELIGFTLAEVDSGRAVFEGMPAFKHYNPHGTVHGGYTATLLDSCMGCAVSSTLPAGTSYTTLEFKVSLIRPLTADTGLVRAEGKTLNSGRRVATAEGRLSDAKGRLLAHATTTCLIFELQATPRP